MAVDIKRTEYGLVSTIEIAAGAEVKDEGQLLVSVLEDGVEKVKPSAGLAGESLAGFAAYRQLSFETDAVVEEGVVPASAPYTLELSKNNLVAGQIRVYSKTAAADLTLGAAANAGEFEVDLASGVVTFNAAEAGAELCVFYRHNLTVAEAIAKYNQATVNFPDVNFLGNVGVGRGKGRIFTYYYDASIDWSSVDPTTISAGAGGILTAGGAGPVVGGAKVIKLPEAGSDNSLGLEFLI